MTFLLIFLITFLNDFLNECLNEYLNAFSQALEARRAAREDETVRRNTIDTVVQRCQPEAMEAARARELQQWRAAKDRERK